MSYLLKKVEDQLRKAFERAKEQVMKGKVRGKAEMGLDIGHEKAITMAQNAPVFVGTLSVHKDRLIQRGRFRYHWEPHDSGDIYEWKLHVPDRRPYPIFLLRARLYLVLRGVPHKIRHLTKTGQLRQSSGYPWPLKVTEEAIEWAGIQLQYRGYCKPVPQEQGMIHSPWTGKIEKAIEPPPSNGGRFVREGDVLFVIRVWSNPSMSSLHNIQTNVGGTVLTVKVKRGDMIVKDQLLIKLDSPYNNTSPF